VLDAAVFAAVAVVLGGVVAASARDGRVVVLGLMLAAVAASLVASPLPGSLAVTARILGAMLAAYLLWAAAGSGSINSAGSAIGLVAEAAVAVAAFAVGLAMRPVDPLAGPVEAQAAGLSLIALAIVPLAGRDVFRMGVGVTLLTLGSSLLVGAWSGPTPPLEQLAMAALLVGIAGATSLLIPSVEAVEVAADYVVESTPEPVVAPRPVAPRPVAARPVAAGPVAPLPVAPLPVAVPTKSDAAERAGTPRVAAVQAVAAPKPMPAETPKPIQPILPIEPERRPRPMTAEPEADDWLAWEAPAPEPAQPVTTHSARRAPVKRLNDVEKPPPKKSTRSRPHLGGKP
jgi:hypothetical protein